MTSRTPEDDAYSHPPGRQELMIRAYRDMLISSHLREQTVTKSIWPCGQSDSAALHPHHCGFERTDRTQCVEPTPTLALFIIVSYLRWPRWFRRVMPAREGGRGSHQPLACPAPLSNLNKFRHSHFKRRKEQNNEDQETTTTYVWFDNGHVVTGWVWWSTI
jgi:hypothetical protein